MKTTSSSECRPAFMMGVGATISVAATLGVVVTILALLSHRGLIVHEQTKRFAEHVFKVLQPTDTLTILILGGASLVMGVGALGWGIHAALQPQAETMPIPKVYEVVEGEVFIETPESASALGRKSDLQKREMRRILTLDGSDWKKNGSELITSCRLIHSDDQEIPIELPFCLFVKEGNYRKPKDFGETIEFFLLPQKESESAIRYKLTIAKRSELSFKELFKSLTRAYWAREKACNPKLSDNPWEYYGATPFMSPHIDAALKNSKCAKEEYLTHFPSEPDMKHPVPLRARQEGSYLNFRVSKGKWSMTLRNTKTHVGIYVKKKQEAEVSDALDPFFHPTEFIYVAPLPAKELIVRMGDQEVGRIPAKVK